MAMENPMRIPTRLALIAGVALTLTLAACGDDPSDADQGLKEPTTTVAATTTEAGATTTKAAATTAAATTAAPTTAKAGAPTTARPIAINSVRIGDLSFGPQNITVPVGTTVTWTNADNITHSIVFEDGSVKSPTMIPGQTFSTTLTKTGTVKYYSGTVNYMTGTIIVTAAPSSAAAS